LRSFRPARGQAGRGAWEIAAQFSQLSLDQNNFAFVAEPGVYSSRCDQLMVGVNWWPNRYTRISVDNVFTWFNQPVLLGNAGTASQFNTFWMRCAMFF
jgi:phosphate-selective porin OprO/OprP